MKLSVVIPCFNEQGNVSPLTERLVSACSDCCDSLELIFVDDGSTDQTADAIRKAMAGDPRIRLLVLSRNFGHENATTAGLDHATGDAVVIIDADLQDPPELIPSMVERWRDGVGVVYAQRRRRSGESVMKRASASIFYRVLGRLSEIDIPRDTGDFRLMDRAVVDVVRHCRENPRFVRGLVAWAGFRQEALPFDRDGRHSGKTKYDVRKLTSLAIDSLSSFSVVPLRWSIWLGLSVTAISAVLMLAIVVERLFLQSAAPRGYAFLAFMMLFIGGIQLIMLGMLGLYVGSIFRNVQGRPLYVVGTREGFTEREAGPIVESKPARVTQDTP